MPPRLYDSKFKPSFAMLLPDGGLPETYLYWTNFGGIKTPLLFSLVCEIGP